MKTLPRFIAAPYQNAKRHSSSLLPSNVPDKCAESLSKLSNNALDNAGKTNLEGKEVCFIGKDEPCSGCKTCLRFWY